MQVIEVRNYVLQPGRRDDFIRHFEEQFLFSQRDTGMHVLGQFAVADQPDRFLWIRGFADMAARRRGLDEFYDGAFWQARRAATTAALASATSASATVVSTSSVVGSMVSKVLPLEAATHLPPISRRLGPDLSQSSAC